jgi:HAD superfamily hydrolase (TIGR01509 family)
MRALLFDLDGTLVDTVYAHVLAWQLTLAEAGMPLDGWKIHRRIGMSGGLFTRALAREVGHAITPEQTRFLQDRHGELYRTLLPVRRPLPGAVELLRRLYRGGVPHGIATSGRRPDIDASLAALELAPDVVVVDRQAVPHAKPAPDLFLECRRRLGVPADECYVVGDAVWDLLAARRAHMLGIGLLTGGYGQEELLVAGAYQVFRDAAELDEALEELGVAPGGSQE